MPKYEFKYLKVLEKVNGFGKTVCRVDVSHLNKKGRETEWDRLDAKYPKEHYIICYEQRELPMPCFEHKPELIDQ